jgi:sn-glycerol 3-phosphate transport system substrate-binding protein
MNHRLALVIAGAALVAVACSGGDSILDSGNQPTTTMPATTTLPSDDGDTPPDGSATDGVTTTEPAATTTTIAPVELPDCPVDALDDADQPVEVLFWYGLTGETQEALIDLTDRFNAAQSRVRVRLEHQGSYDETFDKYIQSGHDNRPDLVLFTEYMVRQTIDTESVIPVDSCIRASGFDTSPILPAALKAYTTEGVQWSMPFNVSNPVLYYLRSVFREAGLDPDDPPQSLDELRDDARTIVDSGAAAYGIAVDSNFSAFGGWVIEQWFANAGELYADNGNGRLAPATRVLYDSPLGVELLTYVQGLVADGLAFYVGDNAGGLDNYLKLADRESPAAMTFGSSASLGTIIKAVEGGLIPGVTVDDVGVGPLPGPSGTPTALVGGATLFIVADHGDDVAAAAWEYIQYLVSAEVQSEWASRTGYAPLRSDAIDLEPLATTYAADPRFRVAYDQLIGSPDEPALQGPILGPQREVRVVTARAVAQILEGADVQTALSEAAAQANALIREYNARN